MTTEKLNATLIAVVLSIMAGIILVSGCGSKNKSTNPNPPVTHSAHYHNISIQNFAFVPATDTVAVGDTILWTNNDGTAHTVTSDTGSELGGQLGSSQTYQHIFATAGEFLYHCTIHTTMHGLVIVH
jgi:plastocyanin